jgi:hypothetical protein
VHHPHSAPPPKVIERTEASPPAQKESAKKETAGSSPIAGWTPKR